jgi:anaerobic ribonucleoside-triphosphate reductase activating protein
MRVHALLSGSRANGPGLRSVLWTQGCSLGCKGCVNPETWDADGGYEVNPNVIAYRIIRDAVPNTEGLTISGGEPLQQGIELQYMIYEIKRLRPAWSVGLFSGYSEPELRDNALWPALRATLDFAVVGRYDRTQPCNNPLVSSANQELVLLSNRYKLSDFPAQSEEVFVGPDGFCQITGFAR